MVNAKEAARTDWLYPPAGWLLLAVSALALVEAFGLFRRNWLLLWPGVLLAGGVAAAAGVTLAAARRGLGPRRLLDDAQLRPQAALAALALAGGLGEVLRAAGALAGPLSFLWPLCLLALGGLLLPGAGRIGLLVFVAGLLRGWEALFGIQPGAVGTGWFVFLFFAALQWVRLARPRPEGDDR
jgi:hypothetical protein